MTKVLVIGDGRMGTIIRELVEADESLELTGVIGIDNKDELADATPAAGLSQSTSPIRACSIWLRLT